MQHKKMSQWIVLVVEIQLHRPGNWLCFNGVVVVVENENKEARKFDHLNKNSTLAPRKDTDFKLKPDPDGVQPMVIQKSHTITNCLLAVG